MPDSAISVRDATGAVVPVDAFDVGGEFRQVVMDADASLGARASTPASLTDTALVSANPLRHKLLVLNNSPATLYLGLGTAPATAADCTVIVPAYATYEVPGRYTGVARGAWSAATGSAVVTELT